MATVSIATASAGTVTYANGEGFDFATGGKYLIKTKLGSRLRQIAYVAAPGESGQGTQDFGERTCKISFDVIYIGADEATIMNQWFIDQGVMSNVSTITVDGVVLAGCTPTDHEADQPKQTGFGTVRMECKLNFISGRPS